VVPAEADVFAAFKLTPFDKVKAVIVGDEPPQNAREADGLAFSAKESARPTAASKNVSQELRNDLGLLPATTGSLEEWARNGVLLLNGVLTARVGKPGSHANKGWETFTDAVLKALNARADAVAFLLWGDAAHKKAKALDARKHIVQPGPHPADAAFVGSR